MIRIEIDKEISIGDDQPLAFIGGPCVIESAAFVVDIAGEIQNICRKLQMPFVFKSSIDKANRTAINSFRGVSLDEGVSALQQVKDKYGIPVITDIHESHQASQVAQVVDILQIPAFLSRQTDLLLAAAATGRVVNVKKGQFLAPWDMKHVVKKLEEGGCTRILLTERGASFGYNTLVVDMRSLPQMRSLGYPVVFDAGHSVQMPGGMAESSGGQREFIPHLSRAAAAVGIDALFLEVHPDPDNAPSDGPNMVPIRDLPGILEQVIGISEALRSSSPS